ncbi:SPP1 family predicted phage head-tail adaptor [Sphingomonas jejuensis]|uniref:SPP1 family predicted phage head-tail adaptor n=1 Tax=Sphingomonas jejuensis TaxID=904715 RepID=A0ABX0XM24_9SPHN|nr:phage head closure protein [Sphingomonas jejuensis]NJC33864.1 SPP1 family predicted phage head-tail adaptor [Sphingomonas jejuensis]
MARALTPGDYRHRVTIERQGETPNGRGGRTVSWAPIARAATVWAQVLALTGDEALRNLAVAARQSWRVTIRWRDDVLPTDRLVWGEQLLDIKALAPTPDRRELVLICESGLKR